MLKNEKPGIIMILASLVVMGLTVYFLFNDQLDSREKQSREQGLALARLMSSMPWQQVVNKPGEKGLLQAFHQGQNNPDFAYGVIVDQQGQVRSEVTSRGILIPNVPVPREPSSWLNQKVVAGINSQSRFIESHAPLFQQGEHKGFVRLGYVYPKLKLGYQQIPIIATITLPIFLLTPLFYFFLRQEIKPLRKISQRIEKFTEGQNLQPVELHPSEEMGHFMDSFNQFMEKTQAHINSLNDNHSDLLTSSRLLSYKSSKVESILQTMPEAIMVIDNAGVVSYANQKIDNLLGIHSADILNKKPRDWCQSAEIINILSGNNKDSVNTVAGTNITNSPANKDKKFEISTYPLFSPSNDNKLLGRLVVIRDDTEQFYEKQRQREFVSQIAHELKTPLHVLSMYSETLLDEEISSEELRVEAANVIHDEVERLSNLIQNLLSINQCELGGMLIERQRVRMGDFLQDIFNNLTKSDRYRGIQFELDIPPELSAIYIDKALMRIAINNLMTNAIKYNKPGGLVTLEARENDYSLTIKVSDEGYGISEQDQQHIFEKFFRSEDNNVRQQTGHGLGLSLTQQIIQIHQGEISLNSTVGIGSEFQITLDKEAESITGQKR